MRISTYGFSKKEHLILQEWLRNYWQINCKITPTKGRGFYLTFSAKDRDLFFNLIRKHVIPSMQYKVLPKIELKTCMICNRLFLPKRAWQKTCGRHRCKLMLAKLNRGWKPKAPRPCAVCGTVFVPIQEKEKGCSPACKRAYRLQQKRIRRMRNKKPLLLKVCIQCGVTFTPTHGNQKACSQECRDRLIQQSRHRYQTKIAHRPSMSTI